jgi:hypothetical protein
MAPSDDRPEADAAPTPPARIREFLADLDDDRADLTFDDETVEVPSRFDRPAATARWHFDGTLRVRIDRPGERE